MNVSVKILSFSLEVQHQCSRCHTMRDASEFIGRAGKVMKTCKHCRDGKAKKQ